MHGTHGIHESMRAGVLGSSLFAGALMDVNVWAPTYMVTHACMEEYIGSRINDQM